MASSIKQKKISLVDYKYSDELISRFINVLMKSGKRSVAIRIVYGAIEWLGQQLEADGVESFKKAIENVRPSIEVKSRRVGGATYQVPIEIAGRRQEALAIRWLIRFARKRNGKSMIEKLGRELLDAHNSTGMSYKKMEETHKVAEANKAFSHYRL